MKPKSVSTQTKALGEFFAVVVLTLLLNIVYVFAKFTFNLDRENMAEKGLRHSLLQFLSCSTHPQQ